MAPVLGASLVPLEKKKCPPARLRAFGSLRYKDHIAFGVGEDDVRMGGNVVEEVMGSLHGVFSGCGLGGGE